MKRTFDCLEKGLTFMATLFLLIFSVTTFLQVVLRTVEIPIVWAEEVARFSFIYMVFIGSAIGVRKGAHYSFDVFAKIKDKTISLVAQAIVLVLEFTFLAFLFYTGLLFIPQMASRASSIMRIPTSIPYASIIVFAGIGMLFVMEKASVFVKRLKKRPLESAGLPGEERGIIQ